jgi:hypothetical protein
MKKVFVYLLVDLRFAIYRARSDIIKLAKSASKCAASVAKNVAKKLKFVLRKSRENC